MSGQTLKSTLILAFSTAHVRMQPHILDWRHIACGL